MRAAAGIKTKITPQGLRRLAGNVYEQAITGAGQLLLGHTQRPNISYLHYITEINLLRPAADKIPIPFELPCDAPTAPPASGFEFDFDGFTSEGQFCPMSPRRLKLLKLLVAQDRVTYDDIRTKVCRGNLSRNSVKQPIHYVREMLREFFDLGNYNPIPWFRDDGAWVLALPQQRAIAAPANRILQFPGSKSA